jgi:hypothetical protein
MHTTKATLKTVGQTAVHVGWCMGIAWQTIRAQRARRPGFLPAIGTFAHVIFAPHHPEAALNLALLLRQHGYDARFAGLQCVTAEPGYPRTGWVTTVAILTPAHAREGWAAAPRYVNQGAIARADARWERIREERRREERFSDAWLDDLRHAAHDEEALEQALDAATVPYRDLMEERRAQKQTDYRWVAGVLLAALALRRGHTRLAATLLPTGRRPRRPQPDFYVTAPPRTKQADAARERAVEAYIDTFRPALYESRWYEQTYGRPLRERSDAALERAADEAAAHAVAVAADDAEVLAELGPWDGCTDATEDGELARELGRYDHSYRDW